MPGLPKSIPPKAGFASPTFLLRVVTPSATSQPKSGHLFPLFRAADGGAEGYPLAISSAIATTGMSHADHTAQAPGQEGDGTDKNIGKQGETPKRELA
ncbi:hypothetical protein ASC97_32420 [Rhizobium sp. Root1203]|uniref:hypothetical protein n=1 Tax=Rhizobium sp. Root1203 TaxID=1736427 RepID=UPI000710B49C|nr:hypothetical protein [Rhizobium sp. Root1203]KQV11423.1 hypothetical protein ASC97_32420 [Rhizobium sp. Root1203]